MERTSKGSLISIRVSENTRTYNGKRIMQGVVTRNRLTLDNIVARIKERSPGMAAATIRAVAELFCDEIGYSLEEGDTVILPGVGLLRLGLKSYIPYSEHPTAKDIKGFKVKFTPDKGLTKRVNNINIDRIEVTTGCPVVNKAEDMGTHDSRIWDATHPILVKGKDIKPLKDPDSGIYLAPLLPDKTIPKDINQWYRVEDNSIMSSTNITLSFILPRNVPLGKEYKLVLRRGRVQKSDTLKLLQTEVDWAVRVV